MDKPTLGPWEMYWAQPYFRIGTDLREVCAVLDGRSDIAQANGGLIVAACNACQAINPTNPQAAAEGLPELFGLLHRLLDESSGYDSPGLISAHVAANRLMVKMLAA
jgi:hypothetical protein